MGETSFTITYDGPALEANQMQVRDLAPALLAKGEAVNGATWASARVHNGYTRQSFRTAYVVSQSTTVNE